MLNRNCKFLIFREIKKAPILKSVLLGGERVGMGRCRIKCGGMDGTLFFCTFFAPINDEFHSLESALYYFDEFVAVVTHRKVHSVVPFHHV